LVPVFEMGQMLTSISCPFPLPVRCACAAPLWRVVLGTERVMNRGQRVLACMRCGAVTAVAHRTEPIPLDVHDAVRVTGFEPLPLTASARAWLGQWPRRVGEPTVDYGRPEEVFFLPPSLRDLDAESLEIAEQHARAHGAAQYDERDEPVAERRLVQAEQPPGGVTHGGTWSWRAVAGRGEAATSG
jgi:hypothetical protein